jgi:hypothetical protein
LSSQKRDFIDIDLSFSGEKGSCPYLLSWNDDERDWTELGKVLDRFRDPDNEQSETVTISGLSTRFRLEEREAEVATVDRAELVLTLLDGTQVAASAVRGSMLPLRIFWGQGREFVFSVPPDISAHDVSNTRLTLTGYYQRYSSLSDPLYKVSGVVQFRKAAR